MERYNCLCTTILNNGRKKDTKDVVVIIKANGPAEAKVEAKKKLKRLYGKKIEKIIIGKINRLC